MFFNFLFYVKMCLFSITHATYAKMVLLLRRPSFILGHDDMMV